MGGDYKVNEYGEIIRDSGNNYDDIKSAIQRAIERKLDAVTIRVGSYGLTVQYLNEYFGFNTPEIAFLVDNTKYSNDEVKLKQLGFVPEL